MSNAKITPKPGKETVYIDVEDEITAIIDKVDNAKEKIVALVLPKRATALQSVVNMRLLKRSADNTKKNVVLITADPALIPLAGAAGLYVAKNLQSKPEIPPSPLDSASEESQSPIEDAEETPSGDEEVDVNSAKIDYTRSIGELASAHNIDEPEVISLGDEDELPKPKIPKASASKGEKGKKLKVPNFERFRLMLFGGIALLIGLIVFIVLAIFVLPKASIAIQTTSSPVSANLTLAASDKYTELDLDSSQIPASLKATNQNAQQQVPATGQVNQGNKASGSVKLSNCTNKDVTIPAGTGVSGGGLTYITQSTISLDSGNFTSGGVCKTTGTHIGNVNVLAQKGGSNYNLPSGSSFTVAGFSGVTGTNPSAFSGGTDNNVTVVSQQDVDNAKAKATSQNSEEYTQKFIKQLEDEGSYVLKSTLKAGEPAVTATPAVGQQASTTTVSMQITYTVLVVKKDDLKTSISDTLNEQIDKTKQKISTNDVLKDATVSVQNQTSPTTATLAVSQTTTAVPIIDISLVKKLSAGQKKGYIKDTISRWPGVKNVEVKTSPFWVSKVPSKQGKITVTLQQVPN